MTSYRLPDGVLRAALEDQDVVLNTNTGVYHLLNASGASLLAAMDGGASWEDAVAALAGDAGLAPEAARADAEAFRSAMIERGLLEPSPAAP